MPKHEMTKSDSERIQSTQAKSGGDMSSGGFGARAQSAGDRNAAQGGQTQGNGAAGGNTQGNQASGKK
ncbi:hypothetical protein BJ166DRAFT_263526 [Pestalotiopsis sp. NC0098]|nr:hypothetical protein BJ166DRAFT_263526 [Pestalotiopsis sp. NC0098]